jgi:hypothetical protein
MPQNDFKAFAIGGNADVVDQATYSSLPALASGFGTGTALSSQLNKVWRQASTIAEAVAQYIVDHSGQDVLDNGVVATIVTNLALAIGAQIEAYHYAPLASPALTGNPTAPTQSGSDNSTRVATTQFVKTALVPYAPTASPTFTGTPSAPSPARGDDGGKLATTHFVIDEITNDTTLNARHNSVTLRGIDAANGGQIRMELGGYGVMLRNDGSNFYILMTNPGQPTSGYNNLRPFIVNLQTGAVTMGPTNFGGEIQFVPATPNDSSNRGATTSWVQSQGFLRGVTNAQVLAALGFMPIQQGGGAFQGGNKVYLGWSGNHLRLQVDALDIGDLALVTDLAAYTRFADFPGFVGANGWTRLSNGLYLQWGTAGSDGPPRTINFPVAFPNEVFAIFAVDSGDFSQGIHTAGARKIQGNLGQFLLYGAYQDLPAATTISWFALGR